MMKTPDPRERRIDRRGAMRAGIGAALGLAVTSLPSRWEQTSGLAAPANAQESDELFAELDAKIADGMTRYQIPGVAIGVYYQGQEYVRGYGITNVDAPVAVDGDTLFRIASTTKTFTGTTVMRLVEQGKLDLNAPVRRYLPDFHLADEAASAEVTLRQCLNHSAGWVGDDEMDFGRGDDALRRYIASMTILPQLTSPGTQFAYNNTALDVAGRVIEVVTDQPYEEAVQTLLLDPLQLNRTRFFTDELAGYPISGSHNVIDGRAVFTPGLWYLPRNGHPDGGLISSAREQLAWARFHLGDGRTDGATPVLTPASLKAMRSQPGPGGTLLAEIEGFGVSFAVRRTAEGVPVIMHGGSWPGQYSGFLFVPERDFALTMLTNSEGGPQLRRALFDDDWALQCFAGLHNPPAQPVLLPASRLTDYDGTYLNLGVDRSGNWEELMLTVQGHAGALRGQLAIGDAASEIGLTFYRDEYVLVEQGDDAPAGSVRANFVRDADGHVASFSYGGRLYLRQP
jgi:CubicO group peptidase (beta-lactamase class C family)